MSGAGRLSSVDLFAGAGGLTLGLQRAGFDTLVANDNWRPALDTLRRNFGETMVEAGCVRELTGASLLERVGASTPSLVAGGPPCQGFTSAGARRCDDLRNTLVGQFARLVVEVQPRWFMFENVEGMLTASGGDFVIDLLDGVLDGGYSVRLRKVNVANFGVPQLRKRVIAIGTRGSDPGFPPPSHRAYGAPGAQTSNTAELPPAPTVIEALEGIGEPAGSEDQATVQGHFLAYVSEFDTRRFNLLGPGQTMRDLPEELRHHSYTRRANRRVSDGMPSEKRGGAPAGVRRLLAEQPSKAITSAASREFVHPVQDRCLTLRECARLQGFPDSFEFSGSRSDQATLIGNAIPPPFAELLGRWIAGRELSVPSHVDESPRLHEFHVSNGNGLSPVLRRVAERVNARYRTGTVPLGRGTLFSRRLQS